MKPESRKFELQFIRARNAIERRAITLAKKALTEQYNHFLSKVRQTDKSQWINLADNLPEKPIDNLLTNIYTSCAPLATMTRKHLLKSKADEDENLYTNIFRQRMTGILQTVAGDKISTITATSETAIKKVIRGVLDEADTMGHGIEKITSNLFKEVGRNLRGNGYARAKAIAQTEIISASNQASHEAAEQTKLPYKKFWSTSGLPNIRESHLEAEKFSNDKDGLMPDEKYPNGLLYPGDPNGAAEEVINCYTGDMEIKSAIVSAQKLAYSGNMVKIVTGTGKVITVTPNHYILTENGMVKACNLSKNDNLVCNSENIKASLWNFINSNYINNKPATISKVFNSFVIKFASKMRPVIALDFDNDGARGNGNIHIVNTNRKLLFNNKKVFQNIGNFRFKQSDAERILIERFCRFNFSFNGMFRTSNFIMRLFNLFLSLFSSHFTPFKFFGIGLTTNHYSMFNEMPLERDTWNFIHIRKLIKTHSRFIHLDKVAKIEVFKFNGHVYDFTSLTGTNIVNNIYTSNCRCTEIQEIVWNR